MTELIIRQTRVSEDSKFVDLVIADNADIDEAKEVIHVRVEAEFQHHWRLPAIQRATLQRLQDAISDEIQRTGRIVNQHDN